MPNSVSVRSCRSIRSLSFRCSAFDARVSTTKSLRARSWAGEYCGADAVWVDISLYKDKVGILRGQECALQRVSDRSCELAYDVGGVNPPEPVSIQLL